MLALPSDDDIQNCLTRLCDRALAFEDRAVFAGCGEVMRRGDVEEKTFGDSCTEHIVQSNQFIIRCNLLSPLGMSTNHADLSKDLLYALAPSLLHGSNATVHHYPPCLDPTPSGGMHSRYQGLDPGVPWL